MVEKRPKFTGLFVNSWPARLLTLEIARFSRICWDPKKCRNHHFCSIISFTYTQPLKLDPKKEGPKTSPSTELYQKKAPLPGPLINSSFWRHQQIRGKIALSDFRVLDFWPFLLFLFLVLFAAERLSSKFVPLFRGGQKTGKNKVFFACLVADVFGGGVFPCGVLMLVFLFMYLLRCKCVIHPCCLTCSFCFFPLCFVGGGYSSFYIDHFNGPAPMTKNKIKPQKTPISEILFLMFCIGACTLTLAPGPHNNRNPKPSTAENRMCLLYNALNPVLKCLFLQCFSNINQICPQNRPLTKTITLHNAQNKTGCFRNGLLEK